MQTRTVPGKRLEEPMEKEVERTAQAILEQEERARRERAIAEAREQISAQRAEEEGTAALATAKQRLESMDPAALAAARRQARAALETFATAVNAWNAELEEVRKLARPFQNPDELRERRLQGDRSVAIDDVSRTPEGLERALETLVAGIVRAHGHERR